MSYSPHESHGLLTWIWLFAGDTISAKVRAYDHHGIVLTGDALHDEKLRLYDGMTFDSGEEIQECSVQKVHDSASILFDLSSSSHASTSQLIARRQPPSSFLRSSAFTTFRFPQSRCLQPGSCNVHASPRRPPP
jgi:hypothetical protein